MSLPNGKLMYIIRIMEFKECEKLKSVTPNDTDKIKHLIRNKEMKKGK